MDALKQIRALIADTSEPRLFTDEEIQVYLDLYLPVGDPVSRRHVWWAAADALEAIATSESLISKKIRTQDLSTDGPAVAADLRKHAASLRQRADEEAEALDAGVFEVYSLADLHNEGEEAHHGSYFGI